MSSLSRKFSAAVIGVFWDLEDCPIPTGLSPVSISANIKLALENMGYTGKMSIFAYSAAKQSEEAKFGSANIELTYSETSHENVRKMLQCICIWGIDHRYEPTNLMVISEDLLQGYLVSNFLFLKEKENNLLFAHPRNTPRVLRDTAASTWRWKSLSTGGSPLDGHSMRPEQVTPSPPCPVCTCVRALRLANKQKKRLKRAKRHFRLFRFKLI